MCGVINTVRIITCAFSCSFLIIIFVCYLSFLPFVVNKDFHKSFARRQKPSADLNIKIGLAIRGRG